MAKIRKIYDEAIKPDGSKQVIYPITSTRAVYTPTNITVDTLLNEGYRFGGVVLPTDSPTFTDQRVFYGASVPGVYPNFGGISVDGGEAIFLMYNGTEWKKGIFGGAGSNNLTGFKSLASISELPLEETTIGYLIEDSTLPEGFPKQVLYVWIGENGDTLDGLYQNCGQLRGASAYESAVRNGYEGTVEEWLNDPVNGIKGNGIKSWTVDQSTADSGESTITVEFDKTPTETFKVKNGKGISSITETPSVANGGTNVIHINLSDGTSYDIDVKNGSASDGFYATATLLNTAIPSPNVGDYAFVSKAGNGTFPAYIYVCTTAGTWTNSEQEFTTEVAQVSVSQNTETGHTDINIGSDSYPVASVGEVSQLGQQVIYDVSANNSGATFASLSALLSSENLSTLIPVTVRCGGMSIRFVQSSDNKYVQYRLMSDEWSTTEADWQGVDETPTPGSKNLVESGGVAESIGALITTVSWEDKTSNYNDVPTIKQGTRFVIKLDSITDNSFIANFTGYYDSSNSQFLGALRSVGKNLICEANNDINRIFLNANTAEPCDLSYSIYFYGVKQELETRIENVEDNISELQNDVSEVKNDVLPSIEKQNLLDSANKNFTKEQVAIAQDGHYVKFSNGQVGNYERYAISTVYTLNRGERIIVFCVANSDVSVISTSNNSHGTAGQFTCLVQGNSVDTIQLYSYLSQKDNNYIQVSYDKNYTCDIYICNNDDTFKIFSEIDEINGNAVFANLKDGYTSSTGTIEPNTSRKTTGIIKNNNKAKIIYCNYPYSVNARCGDSPTELTTDLGYIIRDSNDNNISFVELSTSCKYIAFTIVKDSAFNEGELPQFVIADIDSQVGALARYNDYDRYNSNFVPYLYIGQVISDGTISTTANTRRTTGWMKNDGAIYITLNQGYIAAVRYGDDKTAPSGNISRIQPEGVTGGTYKIDVQGAWIAINIIPENATTEDRGVILSRDGSQLSKLLLSVSEYQSNYRNMQHRMKIDMLGNTETITDVSQTIAVCDGVDIDKNGILYAGCCSSADSVSESSNPRPYWEGYLLICNLAAPGKTAVQKKVFPQGVSGFSALGGYGFIVGVQQCTAMITGDDEVTVMATVTYIKETDNQQRITAFVSRKYTPSTDTLASDVVINEIDVLNTTYPAKSVEELDGDVYVISQDTIDDITEIWQNTGIEHPVGYTGQNSYQYYYCSGGGTFKYNSYLYGVLSLGNFSHALCKTIDLIHWEYVCDMPFDQSSEEVAVTLYKNKVYATSRGNYGVDSQWCKIMMCNVSELDGEHWTMPIVLSNCRSERPTIAALHDKLYVMQGMSQVTVMNEGVEIRRARKCFFVFDTDLNQIIREEMVFLWPQLHPIFISYGGNLWTVTSSDKRCLAFTRSGDTRSEISVGHLDEDILSSPLLF